MGKWGKWQELLGWEGSTGQLVMDFYLNFELKQLNFESKSLTSL